MLNRLGGGDMTTIHDVAAMADVSPTTISRYLNNRIDLPKETTKRIDQAILALDYRPNLIAKRLSLGRTETIGLVTPEFGNPFFAGLAAAVEDEAEKHGYSVLMSSTQGLRDRELKALLRLKDRHVDGLIMMTSQPDDGSLKDMVNRHSNVVIIDEDVPGIHAPRLFVENEVGARLATDHLIKMGHRRIAHIGGPVGLLSGQERAHGFRTAMDEAGLVPDQNLIIAGDYTPEFGAQAMEQILAGPVRPTAIFAGSDALILGILRVLRAHCLSVPEDMSLVGFDDSPFSEFMAPPLTTIRQPIEAMGRAGFKALFGLFTQQAHEPVRRFPVTLIERQSVRKIDV